MCVLHFVKCSSGYVSSTPAHTGLWVLCKPRRILMGLFSLWSHTFVIKAESASFFFSLFLLMAFTICAVNLIGNVHWENKCFYYSSKNENMQTVIELQVLKGESSKQLPWKPLLSISSPIHWKDNNQLGQLPFFLFSIMPVQSCGMIDLTFAWVS